MDIHRPNSNHTIVNDLNTNDPQLHSKDNGNHSNGNNSDNTSLNGDYKPTTPQHAKYTKRNQANGQAKVDPKPNLTHTESAINNFNPTGATVVEHCNGDVFDIKLSSPLSTNNRSNIVADNVGGSVENHSFHGNHNDNARLTKTPAALVNGCDAPSSDNEDDTRINVKSKSNDTHNTIMDTSNVIKSTSTSSSSPRVGQNHASTLEIDDASVTDPIVKRVTNDLSNHEHLPSVTKNSPKYNDYINQTYVDTSRRPSVQNDDDESQQLENVRLLINDPVPPIKIVKNEKGSTLNPPQGRFSYIGKGSEKVPKSIVKSPSSNSFQKDPKARVNRLSFQSCKNTTSASGDDRASEGNADCDRPVLHVQFVSEEREPSLGNKKSDCKSPVGSIASRSSDSRSSGSSGSSSSSSSSDDDASSVGAYAEARAPDGGWGWVVVFASFMVNLIADGITFSFGVIYVEFLNYFGEGKAKTAWIGSLFMAIPLLSGPIASFLTDRYGCRKVTVAGSILASAGFVISSFANSMEMLFLTFGILAGFGLSLCYVTAVVIVAYYFEKRRSFATGLSVCGSGIGTFIFAPLTHMLLDEYGWRGTTLILAGIFLNMTVCGMLMRDLEWTTQRAKKRRKERKRNKLGVSADSFSVSNSTNTGGTASNLNQPNQNGDVPINIDGGRVEGLDDTRIFSSLITLPTYVKNGEKVPIEVLELLSTHQNVHNVLMQNYPGLLYSRSFSEPHSSYTGIAAPEGALSPSNPEHSLKISKKNNQTNTDKFENEQALLSWLRKNQHHHHHHRDHHAPPSSSYLKDLRMHRHSLTYRGAMLNINRYRLRASSCPDIYRNSMTTIAKEKSQWQQGIAEFKNLFVDILDFSYFTDIRFLLFAISNLLLYAWYDVPYVYLTDNAIELGIAETDASMLVGVIGIVNMFGEIALGWMGDKKNISPSVVYAVCMGFCGIITALVPVSSNYKWLCSCSGLFGFFIAANYSLTSIILVELITLERFTNAYGLLLLVQGVANLVGPPLAGWIYDITGTYDLSFYFAGFFIAISGVILIILPALDKYRKYRSLKRPTSSDQCETPNLPSEPQSNKCNGAKVMVGSYSDEVLTDLVKPNHV